MYSLKLNWKNNIYVYYLVSIFVGVLVTIFRLDDFNFFWGKYLWAEDGNEFLNNAFQMGFSSLLKPYSGYLHLYPRLISLFATNFLT